MLGKMIDHYIATSFSGSKKEQDIPWFRERLLSMKIQPDRPRVKRMCVCNPDMIGEMMHTQLIDAGVEDGSTWQRL